MAVDLALNVKSWDLVIKNGDFLLIDNAERINQQIGITLKFWLGEWFLNTSLGIPYRTRILVKDPNLPQIAALFRLAIAKVPGVETVKSLTLDWDQRLRTLAVNYSAQTTAGLITKREVLGYGSNG